MIQTVALQRLGRVAVEAQRTVRQQGHLVPPRSQSVARVQHLYGLGAQLRQPRTVKVKHTHDEG